MRSYTTLEPIYSLATPYRRSALAVIRTSGEGSVALTARIFSGGKRLLKADSNTLVHGFVTDIDGRRIDEAVVAVYRSGHGYTGEEAVEITIHGSLPAIDALSAALESAGFSQALPGEFTYRAFMHGRMDLTRAEAVEEIVKARSRRAEESALERLAGNLSSLCMDVKTRLLDILSSLEVQLDYAEDEILEDWVFPEEEVDDIISVLSRVASTYDASRMYADGAIIVLAGRTNAGKSSLFNALLKENRAIVSSEAGTTRDFLEAECDIAGLPVRLFDTAGLRDTDGEIEKEGIRRSKSLMEKADLVIYVTDGSDEDLPAEDGRTMVVRSKSDLGNGKGERNSFSSVTGEGLGTLINDIRSRLVKDDAGDESLPRIESGRQKDAILEVISTLEDARRHKDVSVDLMALYFEEALEELAVITGEVGTEELLENLFSKFCLGK